MKDENIRELVRRHEKQVRELTAQLTMVRRARSNDEDHHCAPVGSVRRGAGVWSAAPTRMRTTALRRRWFPHTRTFLTLSDPFLSLVHPRIHRPPLSCYYNRIQFSEQPFVVVVWFNKVLVLLLHQVLTHLVRSSDNQLTQHLQNCLQLLYPTQPAEVNLSVLNSSLANRLDLHGLWNTLPDQRQDTYIAITIN